MLKILIKKSALMEYMRKSGIVHKEGIVKSTGDVRFEEFKKKVLERLDSLEEDEKELEKSLTAIEASDIGKAGYPVGTIREWKGKKYIKMAQGKWRPKYDGNTRGAKMAVALLKRKASVCTDSRELLQLILENRERFSDAQGRPLPFVKELSEYVSALNDKLESGNTKKTPKKAQKKNGGLGGDEPPKRKGALGDAEKVVFVKELKGKPYEAWNTDPSVFAVYENNGMSAGLAITQDIADIINSHNEASVLEWTENIGKEIHEKYPKVNRHYVEMALHPVRMGYRNGRKEKVMIVESPNAGRLLLAQLNGILEKNHTQTLENAEIGEVSVIAGETGRHGYGLKHIIEQRYKKDGKSVEELAALIPLICDAAMDGEIRRKDSNRIEIVKDGIMAIISKTRNGSEEQWILTGYDLFDEKEKATGAIKEVISQYGYAPEFSDLKRQVGAVIDIVQHNGMSVNEKDSGVSDSRADAPMENAPGQTSETLHTSAPTMPQSAENSNQNSSKATIETIRKKYQSSKSIDGDDDSITLPDGTELEGKWKLVEADAPSASHDERTFKKTEGFPANADGSTINDRDYEHDSAAKEAVIDMAGDFDSRALGIDSPVVVSEDGVVISGNNRTMSSKIAARKGTDRKYVEALAKKARKFGFSSDDVAKFKNPRVVFEMKVNGEYSTSQFAKFNESGKKAQSPVEVAVKVSKTVNAATIESVAEKINQYDTLGELYADQKSMREVFGTLIESGVIKKTDLPAYYTDEGGITNNGKEFLETVLIGSVINESNIRSLSAPGGKEIRQKLVRAIVPLVENKGMKGYSITNELNDAVNIALDIKKNKKFKDAEDYSRQGVLIGENPDPIAIEFAKKLEGTQKDFAEFMRGLNVGLKPAADGEADIFAGGIESRDDILSRYISIKKSIRELLDSF
ncbi:MAG: hypothetical protein K2I95_10485 [Treponemataceae bacterium]|nr:hypothetical protein [Treponemataceae bacterium]